MSESESGRSRSVRHSRDDVAEAALRILDEYGLPDLTMRRLAAALDVQPSALYWHFPNKQTLLAELADRIVERERPVVQGDSGEPGDVRVARSTDWITCTRAEAARLRDALLAFRDGAEVVSSTFALGLGASGPLVRLTAIIRAGGFDAETSARAAGTLLHFVLGHVSHEQQRLQYDSLGVLAGDAHPDALDEYGVQAEAFEFGVTLLVGGLQRLEVST